MNVTSFTLRTGLLTSCALLLAGVLLNLGWAMHWGLIVLIVTPLARVIVVSIEFLRSRDRAFATISICVLLLLVVSLILAAHGRTFE